MQHTYLPRFKTIENARIYWHDYPGRQMLEQERKLIIGLRPRLNVVVPTERSCRERKIPGPVFIASVRFDINDHALLREIDEAAKASDRPRSNMIIQLIRLGLEAWAKGMRN